MGDMIFDTDSKAKHIRDSHNASLVKAERKAFLKAEKERLALEKIQKENGSYIPPYVKPEEAKANDEEGLRLRKYLLDTLAEGNKEAKS